MPLDPLVLQLVIASRATAVALCMSRNTHTHTHTASLQEKVDLSARCIDMLLLFQTRVKRCPRAAGGGTRRKYHSPTHYKSVSCQRRIGIVRV